MDSFIIKGTNLNPDIVYNETFCIFLLTKRIVRAISVSKIVHLDMYHQYQMYIIINLSSCIEFVFLFINYKTFLWVEKEVLSLYYSI